MRNVVSFCCLLVATSMPTAHAQDSPDPATKNLSEARAWREEYKRQHRGCTTPPPPSSGPSLETRFPELKTFKPTRLWIFHSWTGLSPYGPSASSFSLDLDGGQFKATVYIGKTAEVAIAAEKDVLELLRTVLAVGIDEGLYTPRICATDSYPSLDITFENGAQKLRIWTESQQLTPWAIEFGDKKFIAETDEIGKALKPIERQLDWRSLEDRRTESTNPLVARDRRLREIMRARGRLIIDKEPPSLLPLLPPN